jgi:hypothetical protein
MKNLGDCASLWVAEQATIIDPPRYQAHSVSFSTAKAYADRVKNRLGLCYGLFKIHGWSSGETNRVGESGKDSVHYDEFSRAVQYFFGKGIRPVRALSDFLSTRVPHPFRVFQRNGWDMNQVLVYAYF